MLLWLFRRILKFLLETSPAGLEGEALSLNEGGAPPVFRIFHNSDEKQKDRPVSRLLTEQSDSFGLPRAGQFGHP
jgi:hypothetical protein